MTTLVGCTHDYIGSAGSLQGIQCRKGERIQKRMREIMTDNAHKLCMGEMKAICEQEGIKLHTSVRYSPKSNGVAKRMIGLLTNALCAMLPPQIPVGRSAQHCDVRT